MISVVHTPIASGPSGMAWVVTAEPVEKAQTARIESWLLYLPRQHPHWDYYQLGIVSLKDIEGVEPAHKLYPEAEYELIMFALSSDKKPIPSDMESMIPLLPLNFVGQFHGVTPEEAQRVGEGIMRHLLDGKLLAEPEGIRGARQLWQDNLEYIVQSVQLSRTVEGQKS